MLCGPRGRPGLRRPCPWVGWACPQEHCHDYWLHAHEPLIPVRECWADGDADPAFLRLCGPLGVFENALKSCRLEEVWQEIWVSCVSGLQILQSGFIINGVHCTHASIRHTLRTFGVDREVVRAVVALLVSGPPKIALLCAYTHS